MNKSRRSFLKVAGLSVFALSSGLATMAGSAQAGARIGSYEPNAKALKAKRWAMVIDTRAFKNAKEYAPIIEACHKAHNVPTMEGHQDIKWMWLEKFDHAFPDDLNEHLTSRVKDASYPLLCNHCTNPPCVRVCPTQATYQMEDGIIAMDYHRCIGCRFCMAGCPFGARSFNFVDPRKYLSDPVPNPAYPTRMIGVVEKCTFCAERLAVGQMPACVEAAGGRILFGDLNDPKSDVCKALASNYSIRRKPNLGTQPGVYYLIEGEQAMLEKLLTGPKTYYLWLLFLLAVIAGCGLVYLQQLQEGLSITGMSRDVSWGLYISQFTYLVGVAASAVMLVLPAYFHHYKKFKRMIIFGEFMAISAVVMCALFIVVDLGQPQRMMNVLLHPTPNSVMFYDMIVLIGYLTLNAVIGWVTLEAERHDVEPPKWIKPLIYLSILWAFSIHTVTAFLYAGIPGRHYWLTAIMAARFLSSAFCSGPAILLLLIFIVRRLTGFDPGRDAIKTLTTIITYAMCINVFFYLLEVFTAFYSGIPGHQHPLVFLFAGHEGHVSWVTNWMWAAVVMAAASLIILIPPQWRTGPLLPLALVLLVAASWIDKGLGLLIGGFTPNMFETVTEYAPTGREIIVALGVYAVGALVLSLLWKIALGVKRETGHFSD